jgi:hypothetical protein
MVRPSASSRKLWHRQREQSASDNGDGAARGASGSDVDKCHERMQQTPYFYD